jgi:hypothetical protein
MPGPPPNSTHPKSRTAWRQWLAQNHTQAEGVWLISYKKATGKPRVEYDDSVEEALCFGWIDSKVNKLDDQRSMLLVCASEGKDRVVPAEQGKGGAHAGRRPDAAGRAGLGPAGKGGRQLERAGWRRRPRAAQRPAGRPGVVPGRFGALRWLPALGQAWHP